MTLRSQGRGCWRASATFSRERFAHAGYRARTASTSWGGGAACGRLVGFAAPVADGTNVDGEGEVRLGGAGGEVGGSEVPGRRETTFVRSVERTRRLTSPAGGASGHRAGLVRDDSSVRPNHRESAPTSKFAEGASRRGDSRARRIRRRRSSSCARALVRCSSVARASCAREQTQNDRLGATASRQNGHRHDRRRWCGSSSTGVTAHRARDDEMRCLSWNKPPEHLRRSQQRSRATAWGTVDGASRQTHTERVLAMSSTAALGSALFPPARLERRASGSSSIARPATILPRSSRRRAARSHVVAEAKDAKAKDATRNQGDDRRVVGGQVRGEARPPRAPRRARRVRG